MAISQTMSNPSDWIFQPYQNNFSQSDQIPSMNTFTTTTAATSSIAPRNNNNLSPDQGRVSKPAIRKRSRASRRTPTTLLNTDTTNFRAMVQHFTGGPAAPFAARPPVPNRAASTLNYAPPNGAFHVQYPNNQPQHVFMVDNMHGGGGGGGETAAANGNRSYDNYMI